MEPGSRFGAYEIIRPLGSGGTGEVWLARDVDLGTRHAIKVLHSLRPEAQGALLRAGTLLAALRHDHLVRVTGTVQVGNRAGLVMDYVPGQPLDEWIRGRLLPLRQIDRIADRLLDAAAAAHARGWVHCDLTPRNVLIDGDGRSAHPVIVDFGLARIAEAGIPPSSSRGGGTPGYMPQEQVYGHPPDPRWDVFSLGAVLFLLCTGEPAFPDSEAWQAGMAGGGAPRARRRWLPKHMRWAIHAALLPHGQRPADARVLLDLWRPRPRWRWLPMMAVTALLGLKAGLGSPPPALDDVARWTVIDLANAPQAPLDGPAPDWATYMCASAILVRFGPGASDIVRGPEGCERAARFESMLYVGYHAYVDRFDLRRSHGDPAFQLRHQLDNTYARMWLTRDRFLGLRLTAQGTFRATMGHYPEADGFGTPGAWQRAHGGEIGLRLDDTFAALLDDSALLVPLAHESLEEYWYWLVARYEFAQPLSDPGAWTTFDLRTIDPRAVGYGGVAYDGRFAYLAPYFNPQRGWQHSLTLRYDTHLPIDALEAWTTFDLQVVDPRASGFEGAAFDGRFVYFASYRALLGSLVVRYDTHAPFDDPEGWATFDVSALHPDARGIRRPEFDGRYVTFVRPYTNWIGAPSSVTSTLHLRYDTWPTGASR